MALLVFVGGWVHRKCCIENHGRNSFWNLETAQTSGTTGNWKAEIRGLFCSGPFEIVEANLGFSNVGGGLV